MGEQLISKENDIKLRKKKKLLQKYNLR